MLDSISNADLLSKLEAEKFAVQLERLVDLFEQTGKPIEVNFRELVPMHSGIDRVTHLMHPYPAKLLPNIPLFFLNCGLARRGSTVMDPFCGTGTVLLESALSGKNFVGADSNPLARMIASVKTTRIAAERLNTSYSRILSRVGRSTPIKFQPVVDVNHWYSKGTSLALAKLLGSIRKTKDLEIRQFFEVCFSSAARRLSNADPRLSVPVRLKKVSRAHPTKSAVRRVHEVFGKIVQANIARVEKLPAAQTGACLAIFEDARTIGADMATRSLPQAELIITSPPYVGAQKYIRASSLSIGWLGLAPDAQLRPLERQNIGREHYALSEVLKPGELVVPEAAALLRGIRKEDPLRAHIASNYLTEMDVALRSACAGLQEGGHLVLVVGDNSIRGRAFRTSLYLRLLVERIGLKLRLELLDDIRSRGLMTKRNKTAGIISREHIFLFQKLTEHDQRRAHRAS